MSPDEITTIYGKLDRLFDAQSDTSIALTELVTEFRAHREMEAKTAEVREVTCPKGAILNKLVNDVDNVAGIARKNADLLKGLEEWREASEYSATVDGAEKSILMAPLRWVGRNIEKVFVAVAIAYIIWRLGVG